MSVWLWIPVAVLMFGVVSVGFSDLAKRRPGEPAHQQSIRIANSIGLNLALVICILKGGGVL